MLWAEGCYRFTVECLSGSGLRVLWEERCYEFGVLEFEGYGVCPFKAKPGLLGAHFPIKES